MTVANDVLDWAKANVNFVSLDSNEIHVPTHQYPHMHITNSYVVYSKSSSHHNHLVKGNNIYKGVVGAVVDEAIGDAKRVARYIQDIE